MFQFALEPEERLIVDTARAFAREVLRPRHRQHEQQGLPAELFAEYRNLGFAEMAVPTRYGGTQIGLSTRVLVLEELAWADAGATLALQALDWLGPVLESMAAVNAQEVIADARTHPEHRIVCADGTAQVVQIGQHHFTGDLPYVPATNPKWLLIRCDQLLALFRGDSLRCTQVDAAGLSAAGGAQVVLEGSGARWQSLDSTLTAYTWAQIRITLAAMLVGVARAALEYAIDYTTTRFVFGRPVAQHQAPAFTLAEMRMLIEAARLATWCAAKRLEERKPGSLATAAYAYLEAVECALFCTREAVQLLGGHGFLRDHPVEKWMRDARALSLLCGGRDSAADDVNVWGAAKWLEAAHEPPPATEA